VVQRDLLALREECGTELAVARQQRLDLDVVALGVDPLKVGERIDADDLADLPHPVGQLAQQLGALHVEDARGAVHDHHDRVIVAKAPLERFEALELRVVTLEERRVGEIRRDLRHAGGQDRDRYHAEHE
jgi:hypothetical protein